MIENKIVRNLALFIGMVWVLTGCIQPKHQHPSTWSIVAADPATGEVGVASASCVPVAIDGLASLVPGQGVAATQAAFDISNRDRVFELLQDGKSADEIVATVTGDDTGAGSRQYGIITFKDGEAEIAGFTGEDNSDWAGDKQGDLLFPVTAQGNILEGEAVVQAALDAFQDDSIGPLILSDRLMRALEAGSAAGGDTRCNQVVQQTASAAFIMVAQGNEVPFSAPDFGQIATDANSSPSLHLSVSNQVGGPNPIIQLRQEYDIWRANNLPDCPDCDLSEITVPAGGGGLTSILGITLFIVPWWLALVCSGLIILVAFLIIRFIRRRRSNRNV